MVWAFERPVEREVSLNGIRAERECDLSNHDAERVVGQTYGQPERPLQRPDDLQVHLLRCGRIRRHAV